MFFPENVGAPFRVKFRLLVRKKTAIKTRKKFRDNAKRKNAKKLKRKYIQRVSLTIPINFSV